MMNQEAKERKKERLLGGQTNKDVSYSRQVDGQAVRASKHKDNLFSCSIAFSGVLWLSA